MQTVSGPTHRNIADLSGAAELRPAKRQSGDEPLSMFRIECDRGSAAAP